MLKQGEFHELINRLDSASLMFEIEVPGAASDGVEVWQTINEAIMGRIQHRDLPTLPPHPSTASRVVSAPCQTLWEIIDFSKVNKAGHHSPTPVSPIAAEFSPGHLRKYMTPHPTATHGQMIMVIGMW